MKLLPTLIVLAAFGVLLYITNSIRGSKQAAPTAAESGSAASPGHHEPGAAPAASQAATEHGAPTAQAPASGHSEPPTSHPQDSRPAQESRPAPAATSTAPPAARPTDGVAGVVVDRGGDGKVQLEVLLTSADGKVVATTKSDSAGRFVFANLAPGTYAVSAHDPDFLYTASTPQKVAVTKGQATDVKLTVERGTSGLRGVVLDGEGKAIADKRVTLSAGGTVLTVSTDAKGHYLVNGLAEGDWKIAPEGFDDLAKRIHITPGATIEAAEFRLQPPAGIEVLVVGNHLHAPEFHGGEKAILRPAAGGKETEHPINLANAGGEHPTGEHAAAEHGTGEHAAAGRALFTGMTPGNYLLDVVDATGTKSLLSDDLPFVRPIPVTLVAGETLSRPFPIAAATRGAGVKVPDWAKFLMFVGIGLLLVATPILFPPPLVAKRPANVPAASH